MLVAIDGLNRAFSKREVNIWDIAQSAYIVEKAGGKVIYEDGTDDILLTALYSLEAPILLR